MADDSHPIYSPDHFPSPPEDDPVEIAKKLGKVIENIIILKDRLIKPHIMANNFRKSAKK